VDEEGMVTILKGFRGDARYPQRSRCHFWPYQSGPSRREMPI